MIIRTTLSGGKEFQARIARITAAVTPKQMETAVVAGALKIVTAAKQNIVDNGQVVTGTMLRSMHIGGHADLTGGISAPAKDLGPAKFTNTKVSVLVGTDLVYAPRQEFGFTGTDSLGRHFDQPPKPFLRPAWDEHKDDATKEVGNVLRLLIAKASKP